MSRFHALVAVAGALVHVCRGEEIGPRLQFRAAPTIITMAELASNFGESGVTDIEAVDLNGDGFRDVAVAWFATNPQNLGSSLRRLTLLRGSARGLEPWAELNLFQHNAAADVLSVFRNGTAELAAGDFDGDGDTDLAATAFFGDELWLIENRGAAGFHQFLKFSFGFNSPANFLTPPRALSGDFDGNGRDELVYIADPIQHIQGKVIHFWRTTGTISAMSPVGWEGQTGIFTQWTRGLAVYDFSGDGRDDLCFTGTISPPDEQSPILTFWSNLNLATGRFSIHHEVPAFVASDCAFVRADPNCAGGVMLGDIDGTSLQSWRRPTCSATGVIDFDSAVIAGGLAGLSVDRGVAVATGDVDGDGFVDVVTKQRLGETGDANQIQIALGVGDPAYWDLSFADAIDTSGLRNNAENEILRPRNLVVADLYGPRVPEIIGGFGKLPPAPGETRSRVAIAVWENGCRGDVNRDGRTDDRDLSAVLVAESLCAPHPRYDPHLDLDHDGCIDGDDYEFVAADWGCRCCPPMPGDLNCDGQVNIGDIAAFAQALSNPVQYQHDYPFCDPIAGDLNHDGTLSPADISLFILALLGAVPA